MDLKRLADEIATAYRERRELPTLSSRDSAFDVMAGYAVEAQLVRKSVV